MRPTAVQPFLPRSWVITLLIGLVFVGLEYGLRLEVEGTGAARSPLDLALLLCGYLFIFCLKPIQKAVQRKLCQRPGPKKAGRAR
ncbi:MULTISPECIES: hypothetical protein [Pseudomonas]|jgi:hypothetical protein|uniref:Uncharacterized protein n=2 Tax=Pseudomonas TaxID=286 RepID=A0A4Y9TKY2_PSEFL|nr:MULTISPECIES: hypothetical protein [Pseudomonas]MCX9154207.1 hypothetical protein [Pseudomonas sp. TB1-B1]QXH65729.1 hypothetical protein KSS96_19165 [Pseudomonas asgharzadehiana]TFW45033.1 hypothetical protein E4T65_00805 [Pseudomonas fluorescens]TKJ65676.1 hypothetical protein PspCFBP13506_02505 [Pseudomonas sp. CFBP13506]